MCISSNTQAQANKNKRGLRSLLQFFINKCEIDALDTQSVYSNQLPPPLLGLQVHTT